MSEAADTPITGAADPAPAAEAAPAKSEAAPAADAGGDEEFLPDTTKSDAKPEGEAKDGKTDAKSDDKADDFLAETDDDDAEGKADAPGDAKPESAAEAYQPFELPEGMAVDENALAKATPIFRELNLDQAQAQKLVSLQADIMLDAVKAHHQALSDGHANTLKTWANETKSHPEFGGQNLKASKALAAQALALEPAARKVLVEYGIDRNPHVFALLCRLGSKLSPDSLVRDDAGAPVNDAPMRDADVMYS